MSKLNTVLLGIILAVVIANYWTIKDMYHLHDKPTVNSYEQDNPDLNTGFTLAANVSAYCPCRFCCGKFADGVTASGHIIQAGDKFVAAPKSIPFGTMIDIPGYGRVPVLDRGGAIQGNKLDVFFGGPEGHQEAKTWGRKYLTVTIY